MSQETRGHAGDELASLFVVTGGGSGIGAAVAQRLVAKGAAVALLDRDIAAASRVSAELGPHARALEVDVSREDEVDDAFATLGQVSGLITCAAIARLAPIVTTTSKHWHEVLGVQLDGTFYCVRGAARSMIRHGRGGSIVAVTSVNSRFSHRGNAAYAAAKAGTEMLVRVAAMELAAADVRVNAVAPGFVVTPMTERVLGDPDAVRTWTDTVPLGRLAEPADVADVVVFLCGNDARWVTGQSLGVDGGSTLRVEPKVSPDAAWSRESLSELIDRSRPD